ncbi:hypothetical protein CICLE_v10022854mg [Citrus x clementina]|uniref:Uncharacterized protein n=1 Tax=Citrus clementina TaxID=85681 RepID=V4TL87_CITCL|nr:hypothetical protein CICLE_v10022854mg [Citrus x clementina]
MQNHSLLIAAQYFDLHQVFGLQKTTCSSVCNLNLFSTFTFLIIITLHTICSLCHLDYLYFSSTKFYIYPSTLCKCVGSLLACFCNIPIVLCLYLFSYFEFILIFRFRFNLKTELSWTRIVDWENPLGM